LINFPLPT